MAERILGRMAAAVAATALGVGAVEAQTIDVGSLGNYEEADRAPTLTRIEGTSRMFNASALLANLDAGNLVAGNCWWELEGGFVWAESLIGFLWSPPTGAAVFEVPEAQVFDDNFQNAKDIADDATVVGANIFTNSLLTRAFQWTPAEGFEFLEQPAGNWSSSAAAVSRDGDVVAGSVWPGFAGRPQAARWVFEELDVIGAPRQISNALDASANGSVLVGEIGPTYPGRRATRWIDGIEVGLDPVAGETFSSARFASRNGNVAIGQADVGGKTVLARWKVDGSVATFTPPNELSIETLHAINPRGTAVVGTLSDEVPFQENWVPFVWRLKDGFTLIGEFGRPDDYDRSQALDVSDDGLFVVGQAQSSVVFNGDPPSIAFLHTPTGTYDLEELLVASSQPAEGLYDAIAISGDGTTILATGAERPTSHHTTSILLRLGFGPALK